MSPTNADLALQITSLISRWDTYTRQLRDWLAGTPDGGPYGDGRYPLQNSLGQVFYVPCPAAQSAMVEGNATSAESFATQAATHALAAAGAKVATETARDLTLSYRDAAQAAKALAEHASNEAQTAEANARYWAQQAQGSAEGIDAVASEIADTADAVAADRVAAEAARVAAEAAQVAAELAAQQAATFDPANYAPVNHTHTIGQITGLQEALDGKAAASHTHGIAQVTGLQAALNGRALWLGEVRDGVYDDHVVRSSAAAFFHSSGYAPSDRPISSQASVLHLGNTWGRAQLVFPNSGTNRVFVRTGTRTEWSEVYTTANLDPTAFAPVNHTHTIEQVEGLQAALDGKAASVHTHTIEQVEGLQEALDDKAASVHTHTIEQVEGLQEALDGKADGNIVLMTDNGVAKLSNSWDAITKSGVYYNSSSGTAPTNHGRYSLLHMQQPGGQFGQLAIRSGADNFFIRRAGSDGVGDWCELYHTANLNPAAFAPVDHSHTIGQITGLQSALDGKAAASHTHGIAQVTGLQAALDGKAASSHTHTIADVTGLQSELSGRMGWLGQVAGGVYSDHVAQSSAAAFFHSAGNAPADAPVSSQASVLHLGNTWGRAQVFFPNSGINRMFVRTGTRTEWAEVLTTANSPRIFVQSTDPDTAASDGDLWVW